MRRKDGVGLQRIDKLLQRREGAVAVCRDVVPRAAADGLEQRVQRQVGDGQLATHNVAVSAPLCEEAQKLGQVGCAKGLAQLLLLVRVLVLGTLVSQLRMC